MKLNNLRLVISGGRQPRFVLFASALICILTSFDGGLRAQPGEGLEGCEPGGPFTVGARVVSVSESEGRAVALIELTIVPGENVLMSRVRVRVPHHGPRKFRRGVQDRDLPLARGLTRQLLYEIELPSGRDADLYFSLENADDGEPLPGARAWVRVALSPASRARRHDGLVEFKAAMEEGAPE